MTVIQISTKRKSTISQRTTVAPVVASQVINGRTVTDPFRYQQWADEEPTPTTQGKFVPNSKGEDHRSPPCLIEAGKEIQIM